MTTPEPPAEPTPAAEPAPAAKPAPAARAARPAAAAKAAPVPAAPPTPATDEALPGLLDRVNAGEFDADGTFHRFIARDVYPLLGQGKLTTTGLVTLTRTYSLRNNPHTRNLLNINN
jgi:hypothetical protein